jgi:sugar phosphate isomerase/epimerase
MEPLSLTSDYKTSSGTARPYLKAIAEAGFTNVHWCHEWNTDTFYSAADIREIGSWLKEYRLSLLDLHASEGKEISWGCTDEDKRKAGVNLVVNRMEMTAELGSDVIVLHVKYFPDQKPGEWLPPVCRSLEDLERASKRTGVRIALENTGSDRNDAELAEIFSRSSPEFIGMCYDSGHGNFHAASIGLLESNKHRLLALHLHDNDGTGDQHLVPFFGTVDWPRITRSIAESSYRKCVNLESSIRNHPQWNEPKFLQEAFSAAQNLSGMIRSKRSCV